MLIIHGENTIASREKLIDVLNSAKQKNQEVIRIEAKELSESSLESTLGSGDLFGTKKIVAIEGLHSLPKSKKQKDLIKMCSQSDLHEIVLWEKRSLTKTMLKPFSDWQVFEYKISKTLFAWLDTLGKKSNDTKKLQLLHDALNADGDYFCFIMLIRQFRLLIQAKTGEKIAGAPFMVTKLKNQANNFSLDELLDIYKNILNMDYQQKTSKSLLGLNQWLDLLTIKL